MPVFVDIRADTLNIDESLIEAARTDRTRAIMPIHYAGVCAEMDAINAIARPRRILVIEDAAQAFGSTYRGTAAGILGDMACFSFHESQERSQRRGRRPGGGAEHLRERADIIREKGTNRRQFMQGTVDKYSWVDIGSSYLPSEIVAACLLAQLEAADAINAERVRLWQRYHDAFADIEGAAAPADRAAALRSQRSHVLCSVADTRSSRRIDRGVAREGNHGNLSLHTAAFGASGPTIRSYERRSDANRRPQRSLITIAAPCLAHGRCPGPCNRRYTPPC